MLVGGDEKGEMIVIYFAIFHKDPSSAVGVVFPDLPGCFAAGDDYDEAITNAREALAGYAESLKENGNHLPKPRSFEQLYADVEIRKESAGAPFIGIALMSVNNDTRKSLPVKTISGSLLTRSATQSGREAMEQSINKKSNKN